MTKISIIIVNYNGFKDTCELLDCLGNHETIEIIVVDNTTGVNEAKLIKELYPHIKEIRSEKNLGFAGGNNLGLAQATGDHIMLLNNDTITSSTTILELSKTLEESKDIDIICPILRFFDTGQIQYAGYTSISPITGRNQCIRSYPVEPLQSTALPHGAAMMFTRKAFEVVGKMSEDYFLYYEEHDWAHRFRKNGFKCAVHAKSEILHKESASVQKLNGLKLFYLTRNRILFIKRNMPKINQVLFMLFFTIFSIPKSVLVFSLRREWENMRVFMNGVKASGIWNGTTPVPHTKFQ